jgi:hypothetical protein
MTRGLSLRGNSVERIAAQGVGPDDARLAPLAQKCTALTTRELKTDFECSISVQGVLTPTRCNEAYAETTGLQARSIRREQYILDGLRGENISVEQVETLEASNARTEREAAQQAAADAAQKAAQATADTLEKKQADATRQKHAAAEMVSRQMFAKRDQEIRATRKACSAKPENNTFARMFANNSDHQVMSSLLNTNAASLQAYQGAISWLPTAADKGPILSALHDRIDYDAKRYGQTIAHSGSGQYSWDSLKIALSVFASNCLWQQYDQLGVAAAKSASAQAMTIATGQAQPVSDADRVSEVILSKIPSSQFTQ